VCVCVFCEQSLEVFGLGTLMQQLLSALFARCCSALVNSFGFDLL
jgi:hypothetical protein